MVLGQPGNRPLECGRRKVARAGSGNGDLRGAGRQPAMCGTRNGTGREAGSSQVEGLEIRPTELA